VATAEENRLNIRAQSVHFFFAAASIAERLLGIRTVTQRRRHMEISAGDRSAALDRAPAICLRA
jgi:hypothetical protein